MQAQNWKRSDKDGARLGTFDLVMDSGMIITGCAVVDGSKGRFVALPQRQNRNAGEGEKKYEDIIRFASDEKRKKFGEQAMEAVKEAGIA